MFETLPDRGQQNEGRAIINNPCILSQYNNETFNTARTYILNSLGQWRLVRAAAELEIYGGSFLK